MYEVWARKFGHLGLYESVADCHVVLRAYRVQTDWFIKCRVTGQLVQEFRDGNIHIYDDLLWRVGSRVEKTNWSAEGF